MACDFSALRDIHPCGYLLPVSLPERMLKTIRFGRKTDRDKKQTMMIGQTTILHKHTCPSAARLQSQTYASFMHCLRQRVKPVYGVGGWDMVCGAH